MAARIHAREMRMQAGSAQAVVDVLRAKFPGFDKTLQSKLEHPDRYGIQLTPEAKKWFADMTCGEAGNGRSRRAAKRPKRITLRLSDAEYIQLQLIATATGASGAADAAKAALLSALEREDKHT